MTRVSVRPGKLEFSRESRGTVSNAKRLTVPPRNLMSGVPRPGQWSSALNGFDHSTPTHESKPDSVRSN